MESLSAAEARRIFLAAQGLARRRPSTGRSREKFREYLGRQGVLQLDSVNVLARAHYLPLFSRYGPYRLQELDDYLWGSGETFEHWGHEASVMPRELLPALRHRMDEIADRWHERLAGPEEARRRQLFGVVEEEVSRRGPLQAKDLKHLEEGGGRNGNWWAWSDTKLALEYLFRTGRAAIAGRPAFQRLYGSPGSVWGPDADVPALDALTAKQTLFAKGLEATWIGTVADVADHFRLKPAEARTHADALVESGAARWVAVEGWAEPALLHEAAADPGRATAAALLSPFDPACWYRDRLERHFGMQYRIEIYTPADKRVYGYYTLPFLLGDQMVARVDLKADRKGRALLVPSAWLEEGPAPGGRRRRPQEVAAALATELRAVAGWLGLDDVRVERRGTLAELLAAELQGSSGAGPGDSD